MVSKAEKARREQGRQARSKTAPAETPARAPASTTNTKPATHQQNREVATAPTTTTSATYKPEMTTDSDNISPRGKGTFNKFAVPTQAKEDGKTRRIADTTVDVFYKAIWTKSPGAVLGAEEFVTNIETMKLYALSGTFAKAFFSLPTKQSNGATKYKWLLDESICPKRALVEVLKWLKNVTLPIPDGYNGVKQLYPPDHWDVRAWAAMFKFTQWLEYKAPFTNAVFFARCRDHIMDDNEYDCMVVIDIYKGCGKEQHKQRLKRGILDRMTAYVEWLDDTSNNPDDDFYRPAHHAWMEDMEKFCPEMAKAFVSREIELADYRTRSEERAEREAHRQKRRVVSEESKNGGSPTSTASSVTLQNTDTEETEVTEKKTAALPIRPKEANGNEKNDEQIQKDEIVEQVEGSKVGTTTVDGGDKKKKKNKPRKKKAKAEVTDEEAT